MFMIKRITDERLVGRILGSYGIDESAKGFAYGAFKDDDVLATAAFFVRGDCLVFHGIDTGRRMDVDLADGMARAAFHAAQRTGIKQGALGEMLSQDLKVALSKRNYALNAPFSLSTFFAKRNCAPKK